jgi:hypothetical protein
MIRLIEQNDEFKSDKSTKPCKGVFDKRLSTMSIDNFDRQQRCPISEMSAIVRSFAVNLQSELFKN